MLMITRTEGSDSSRTLKLGGKLRGPWVEELQATCEEAKESPQSRLRLDLAAVSFADAAGVACLHGLIREGVLIVACSAKRCALIIAVKDCALCCPKDLMRAAASGALSLAAMFPSVLFWRRVLRVLGQNVGLLKAARAYYIGHLGKYVPGLIDLT